MSRQWRVTRRGFLVGSGLVGGALALGIGAGLPELRLQVARRFDDASAPSSLPTDPFLWFEIHPDERVQLYLPKVEMGQGIHTALAQIAAEELEVPWASLEIIQGTSRRGPADSSGTQGSTSVSGSYLPLRQAAATLREMLRVEAARLLALPLGEVVARAGGIEARGEPGRRLSYGTLVAGRTEWPELTEEAPLKGAESFHTIGQSLPRVDLPQKVTGEAIYGYDARVEGMLYGAMLRPARLGATLREVKNLEQVRLMPGVVAVVHEGEFVGVVAESRLQAQAARDKIDAAWNEGRRWQQAELDEIMQVGGRGGVTVQREGNVDSVFRQGKVIEATYRTPMAVHASLEPQAALADVRADQAKLWVSTQLPTSIAEQVASALDMSAEQVEVIPTYLGGGFGRKADKQVALEAARLSRAVGKAVHVGWTREEEMRHGYFRPPTHHVLRGVLDERGHLLAIEHQQASGDVLFSVLPEIAASVLGADFGAWRGATIRYAVPHRRTIAWRRKLPVPTGFWRGLGLLANTFALESFMDEMAQQSGTDPLQFRLAHLPEGHEGQRMKAVLEAVAKQAKWGTPLPEGRARGLACCEDVGTLVAAVAEVSVHGETGRLRVHRVVEAMDCGQVINPNGVAAQMEGNIMWAVGSTLLEQLTIKDGQVEPANFNTYPLLTMAEAPEIETVLLPSQEPPHGVGEPPIGPVAAAIANALFALRGVRLRELPFTPERLRAALG